MKREAEELKRSRWERVEEIYHAALPLGAAERAAYLAAECAGDESLRREVNSLLAADAAAGEFMREPAAPLAWALISDESLAETLAAEEAPPSAPPADLTGTKVAGRYDVTGRLGEGGFGEVYKALDSNLMSRPVVLKVLKDAALREAGEKRDWLLTKFRQEIEALSRLQDSGVVGIFDADALLDGRPYLVMEFVRGSNLRDFMREANAWRGPERGLAPRDAAEVIAQASRTLTAAHDEGIVHRDLKPENIMVRRGAGSDLHVKVIDFGIAKVRNSLVASSTATRHFNAGTWLYMSPEQLNRKRVSAASDIYALGVIAYELLTGRPPFNATDPLALRELQQAGVKIKPRDLNPELPEAAQASILKALSYFPADRHEKARDFGEELARALAEGDELARPTLRPADLSAVPANAEPVSAAPSPDSTNAPRRWRQFFIAAAIVFALLAGYYGWRVYNRPPSRALTYWLSMQRPRDAKPFDTIGERVFEPESQFWFNVQTTQEGALYLFAEGNDANGPSEMNTLFPTPLSGGGDARLAAGRVGAVTQNPLKFRGASGTIYVWVIWAERPVPLLDEIVLRSYNWNGTVTDPAHRTALRTFIKQHSEPRPEVVADDKSFRVTLKGRGEALVDVRKLEYQP